MAQTNSDGKQGFKPTNEELKEWLDKQMLCVIASHGDDGYPNAASVAFSQNDDFAFVIITDKDSRKIKNIRADSKVALTITNADDRYTLQIEGDARELMWEEFMPFERHHYDKLPFSLPFKDIPGKVPVIIVPTRMRFGDITVNPWVYTDFAMSHG